MKELCVYLSGVYTGRLIRKENGNMQFRYASEYLGPPLSQALPVQDEAHPHAVCLAVFGGLLPEGQARESVARNAGVSAHNDFALLEAVGGDCAGADSALACCSKTAQSNRRISVISTRKPSSTGASWVIQIR